MTSGLDWKIKMELANNLKKKRWSWPGEEQERRKQDWSMSEIEKPLTASGD